MIEKRFYCDLCNFEYEEELMLTQITTPKIGRRAIGFQDQKTSFIENSIDICIYCQNKISDYITKNKTPGMKIYELS